MPAGGVKMKVAISTDRGYVSEHFGRCASYTIVEIKEGKILNREEISNPGHSPGFLPQFLSDIGVNLIITGGMGPRAKSLFAQKNIEPIIGVKGSVDETIEKFIKQEIEVGEDLCAHGHGGKHEKPDFSLSEGAPPLEGAKICITSQGRDLNSEVEPSLGRAPYFLIIDPDTMHVEVLDNPNIDAAQGAGIQSAQLISSKNVGAVLTGNCGPNSQRVLESSGIKVITGISGKVRNAISKYNHKVK